MPSQKVLESKKQQVAELAEKFKKSKLVILADYQGISVEDVTKMREDLRKANVDYKVAKNNLLKFAAKENNLEELTKYLDGPTAVVFSYDDYVTPAKVLFDFSSAKENYKIKAGVMDGKIVSIDEIKRLAKLPSRQVLLTQLASALLANIRNLAVVLDQARQKQEDNK